MAPSLSDDVYSPEPASMSSTTHKRISKLKCAGFDISLIEKIQSRINSGDKFYSLEFFPPRTKPGAVNLINRLDRMRRGNPLFVDITWGAGGNPGGDTETSSIKIAETSVQYLGLETMLHMTCVGAGKDEITGHLDKAKRLGLRNILALRGDLPTTEETWEFVPGRFNYGTDLVKHIRDQYGDHFTVCVAGYPGGHPDAVSYEEDLRHLKEKVEAGSDFIITQLFFSVSTFRKFVTDCRALGITCPIIPGILPIQTYDSLRHIVKLSKLEVPKEITDVVEPLRDNNEAIQNYGVHQATQMIRELFQSGVHFYTLNKDVATTSILTNLGLLTEVARPLPFVVSADQRRSASRVGEVTRPIYWAHRPRSYIHRTRHWEKYPRGRWEPESALSDLTEEDYNSFYLGWPGTKAELLRMWGEAEAVTSEEDVWRMVQSYYETSGVTMTPWCSEAVSGQARLVASTLASLASSGVLTTNCQVAASNVPSEDPVIGWGPPGGFISQKGYLEFLIPKSRLASLLACVQSHPGVSYQVVSSDMMVDLTNLEDRDQALALSWAVFPGQELVTPTIAQPRLFPVWSQEVFHLLKASWGGLYPEDSGARAVIRDMAANYLHVWLVDNDFPRGNCLWKLMEETLTQKLKLKSD